MSLKRALIDRFFNRKELTVYTEDSVNCKEQLKQGPAYGRPHSSNEVQVGAFKSRTNSSCSLRSSNIEKLQAYDPKIPDTFVAAVKKFTFRSLQNLQKSLIDENSQCLIYSFLLLLSLVDTAGPAVQVKNSRSKVNQTFYQYVKNPASLIQIIRKLPKTLRGVKGVDSTCQKAQVLFKIVDFQKLSGFFEIFEVVHEALGYINQYRVLRIEEKMSSDKGKTMKEPGIGGSDLIMLNKKPKHTRHGSMGQIPKELTQKTPNKATGKVLNKKDLIKAERFLLESRFNIRIQKKMNQFMHGKDITNNKEATLKEFIDGLPTEDTNKASIKMIELYFNKIFK